MYDTDTPWGLRAELTRIRVLRQKELNEAILEGRSDAPSRSAHVLGVQRALAEIALDD